MATIDILIPYYNGSLPLLTKLLDSINDQIKINFANISVSILNDNDDETSLSQLLGSRTFRFPIIFDKHAHSGISQTRNALLNKSKADYVVFCDQDDHFIENTALSKYFYIIDNAKLDKSPDLIVAPIVHRTVDGCNILNKDADHLNATLLHGCLFKRDFLVENNISFLKCLDGMEDYYVKAMSLQLSSKTICIEGDPLYCWANDGEHSLSARSGKNWVVDNFNKLVRGASIITRDLLSLNKHESAAIVATSFLISCYKFVNFDQSFKENLERLNKIKLSIYLFIKEFKELINNLNLDKLNKLYDPDICYLPEGCGADTLSKWCKELETSLLENSCFSNKNGFSIIIPTYNRKNTLVEAIDSVLKQGYENFEIIIADNMSTDGTNSLVNSRYHELLKNGVLKYIKVKKHSAAYARNRALKYTTKDWIVYLDDDNKQLLNFLETFNYYINCNPDYRCFFARFINKHSRNLYLAESNFYYNKLVKANYIDAGCFVHHRSLCEKYGKFNETLESLEDWELILRYTKQELTLGLDVIVLEYNDGDHDRITTRISQIEPEHFIHKTHGESYIPKVTSLIISYNQEDYIEQALESAVMQRGAFIHEILISDDQSTDKTKDIIRTYADKYPYLIKIVSPQEHLGLTNNYWHALDQIDSDYIAILEGDDYWLPGKLQRSVEKLEEDHDIGLLFSKLRIFNEWSNAFDTQTNYCEPKKYYSEKDLIDCGGYNFVLNLSTCVFRTSIFKSIPEDLKRNFMFSEIPLQFHIFNIGKKISMINEVLSIYRVHKAGVWSGANVEHQMLIDYNTKRAAFEVASINSRKILYDSMKVRQSRMLSKGLLTEDDVKILDEEFEQVLKQISVKGIILAGGSGSRLYPSTQAMPKALLQVYDKPLIYYPLNTLMQAGINDILIITAAGCCDNFRKLLGDGSNFGIKLTYAEQAAPRGIAEAFKIGKNFIGDYPVALILGDNIFYSDTIATQLTSAKKRVLENNEASIFAFKVPDPERFGVIEIDDTGKAISIEEKPSVPKSDYCVTGLYFYPADVVNKVNQLKPSARNELEITDLNNIYLKENKLNVERLGIYDHWFDTGTPDSLLEASNFIHQTQTTEKIIIGCPEATAYKNKWIAGSHVTANMLHTAYGRYVASISLLTYDRQENEF